MYFVSNSVLRNEAETNYYINFIKLSIAALKRLMMNTEKTTFNEDAFCCLYIR